MTLTCDRVRELASGYVLGALDTEEMLDVADHLDSCRLGHPEVDEFGGVLPYLAASLEPVEPRTDQEHILADVANELGHRGAFVDALAHDVAGPPAVSANSLAPEQALARPAGVGH